jgi:CxxC-x17-CxxC domain-containing protein
LQDLSRRAAFKFGSGGQKKKRRRRQTDRPRFEIVCGQCGKTDNVPFKPSAGRPVLCGECFAASRA